ncbi:spore coat protein CotH, partial [Acinetobacter baumannii]|nr:spore coat protein CotH [Acinetobacter baumannii]
LMQLGLDEMAAQVTSMAASQKSQSDQIQALMLAFQSGMRALALVEATPEEVESHQLSNLYAFQVLARQLLPLDGFDPSAAGSGTGNREAQAKYPGVFAFGEPRGLIRL